MYHPSLSPKHLLLHHHHHINIRRMAEVTEEFSEETVERIYMSLPQKFFCFLFVC